MRRYQRKLVLSGALSLSLSALFMSQAVYAAKPIDLSHQNMSIIQSFVSATNLSETKRTIGKNDMLHVRVQQTYQGHNVFGADAVIHIPHGKDIANIKSLAGLTSLAKTNQGFMNGTIYQDLQADLASVPASLLTEVRGSALLNQLIGQHQQQLGAALPAKDKQTTLVVYVDQANKAHWAYQVSFSMDAVKDGALPTKPVSLVDAVTGEVYAKWDNIQTIEKLVDGDSFFGGGLGGNKKMGKYYYDSLDLDNHWKKLTITRDDTTKTCSLRNNDVIVKNSKNSNVMSWKCDVADGEHNGVYWNNDMDAVNGGYGPMNDAMFDGSVVKGLYQDWYNVPVLTEDGKPMVLTMIVHARMDNAYWDGRAMTFGDGISMFYPLTSLGVGAHEVSHGFTEQNSNLSYYGQSGGMNEAFSDMAAQAAEFYAYKRNSWQIGPEIFKQEGQALRYMDKPSKDCNGKKPGDWCSIDNTSQYRDGLDVHFSSGVFNRAFYLLGTSEGWDTRRAFDVMVAANQHYWTSGSTFVQGACGVLKATQELGYQESAVQEAFAKVGVSTSKC